MSMRSAAARAAASAAFRVSSVKRTSRAGMSVASFRSSAVRCVAGSNSRSDSTVSPKSSMRSGRP